MSVPYRCIFARRLWIAALPIAFAGVSASAGPGPSVSSTDPLRFFEGRTESLSTIRVIMRKPYRSLTIGNGTIEADGVLNLVQRVREDGKAPYDRRWRMRQVGPGRFAGTMSEATGPVSVEKVGERFRFRFKMKGNLAVEQWLMPLPDGRSARSKMSVRKLGVTVARSESVIRKL
jgi:hypothetical protein